jgi:hypothetical protein
MRHLAKVFQKKGWISRSPPFDVNFIALRINREPMRFSIRLAHALMP